MHEGHNKAEEDHLSQSGNDMEDDMQPDTDLEPNCEYQPGLNPEKEGRKFTTKQHFGGY